MQCEDVLKRFAVAYPTAPFECLKVIEDVYLDRCVVLQSAKDSARQMNHSEQGKRLLDLLRRFVD